MEKTIGTSSVPTAFGLARAARLFLLAAGPIVSLWALRTYVSLDTVDVAAAEAVLFLAWSPLFFSIPALLCQQERDDALGHLRGVRGTPLRAIRLLPFLAFSRASTIRLETIVSLVMWLLLGLSVWGSLSVWARHFLPF